MSEHLVASSAPQQKPFKGAGMNGWIARWYARTRQNDMQEFRQKAKSLSRHLRPGSRVLEVAPGPGFFAIELAKLGDFQITGLDISQTFVDIARDNARNAGVSVDFRLGNASAIPFPDASVDFVYCSAAFKNFTEPVTALNEMCRVLSAGGEALIDDLRKDASLDEINSYIKGSGRKWLDAWATKWIFRHMLLKRAYTKSDLQQMAQQSRFGTCEVNFSSLSLEVRFVKPL